MMREVGLLVRSPPEAGENARGYLMRLAEINGFDRAEDLQRTGRERSVAVLSPLDAAGARGFAAPWPTLAGRLGSIATPAHCVTLGDDREVPTRFVVRSGAKVCPACLGERPFLRSAWDITLLPICATHRIRLNAACHGCAAPLAWSRKRLGSCDCGTPLKAGPRIPADAAELAIARHLSERAGIASPSSAVPLWERFGLVRSLEIVARFGAADITDPVGRAEALRYGFPPEDAPEAFSRACAVMTGWPRGFHALIERSVDGDPMHLGQAVVKRFPYLYRSIFAHFREEDARFMRRDFLRFIERRWPGWNPRLRGRPEDEGVAPYLTRWAVRDSSLDGRALRRAVSSGQLGGVVVATRGRVVRRLPERKRLEAWIRDYAPGLGAAGAREAGGGMCIAEAARILGVSSETAGEMSSTGLLGPRDVRVRGQRHHARDAASALLRRLQGDDPPPCGLESADLLLLRRQAGAAGSLAVLLDAVLSRGITAVARRQGKTGLEALLFRKDDLLPAASAAAAGGVEMSRATAARLLHCTHEDLKALEASGHLHEAPRAGSRRPVGSGRLLATSVRTVATRLASTRRLASRVGIPARKAGRLLRAAGVRPVVEVGGRGTAFWASDVWDRLASRPARPTGAIPPDSAEEDDGREGG